MKTYLWPDGKRRPAPLPATDKVGYIVEYATSLGYSLNGLAWEDNEGRRWHMNPEGVFGEGWPEGDHVTLRPFSESLADAPEYRAPKFEES